MRRRSDIRAALALALGATACTAEAFPLGEGFDGGALDTSAPDLSLPDAEAPDLGPPPVRFPPGCLPVEGYLLCLRPTVFDEARALCRRVGGDLVVIETAEENALVGRISTEWTAGLMWIGLTDRETEDVWLWLNGRSLEDFEAWTPDEPNDLEGEDCAHINWEVESGWNDIDCFDRYGAVCEFAEADQVSCADDRDCVFSFGRCRAGSCVVQPP